MYSPLPWIDMFKGYLLTHIPPLLFPLNLLHYHPGTESSFIAFATPVYFCAAIVWYPLWASLHFHSILSLPYISFPAVSLPVDDFRAHPVGGASDRLDSRTRHADGLDTFAGSKVSKLHVPRGVSQDVSTWWNETKWAQSYSRVSRGLSIFFKGYFDSFGGSINVVGHQSEAAECLCQHFSTDRTYWGR